MNTSYKKVLSPLQPKPTKNVIDVRDKRHPIHDEIQKLCSGTYDLKVSFEEDTQTLNHFPHIPGLIAILCKMSKNGQPISFGRSCCVFSRFNRYVERTISTAINGSFLSAANNATKVFEALRISGEEGLEEIDQPETKIPNEVDLEGRDKIAFYGEDDMPKFASQKQKNFLQKLIDEKCNESSKEEYLNQLNSPYLSRFDASELISSLLPVK